MRAAIITSKDPLVEASPIVLVEDYKGGITYHSKNRDQDKRDNEHFLAVKKNSPKMATIENMLHGYSYLSSEILKYEGSSKEKIDNFLLQLGHKKLDK